VVTGRAAEAGCAGSASKISGRPSRSEPNTMRLPSGDHVAISDENRPFQLEYASTTAVASGSRAASRRRSASLRTVGSDDACGAGALAAVALSPAVPLDDAAGAAGAAGATAAGDEELGPPHAADRVPSAASAVNHGDDDMAPGYCSRARTAHPREPSHSRQHPSVHAMELADRTAYLARIGYRGATAPSPAVLADLQLAHLLTSRRAA
jgi:hypothetical protein